MMKYYMRILGILVLMTFGFTQNSNAQYYQQSCYDDYIDVHYIADSSIYTSYPYSSNISIDHISIPPVKQNVGVPNLATYLDPSNYPDFINDDPGFYATTPKKIDNVLNGHAVIRFDGVDDLISSQLEFYSSTFRTDIQSTIIHLSKRTAGDDILAHAPRPSNSITYQMSNGSSVINGVVQTTTTMSSEYEIWATVLFTGLRQTYKNGKLIKQEFPSTSSKDTVLGNLFVGNLPNSNSFFKGDMVEIIFSKTGLSSTAISHHSTRLSLLYGVSLDRTVNYTANMEHTHSRKIWDNSSACGHGNYNYDITGIGRSDCANFEQAKSENVSATSLVEMALVDNGGTFNAPNSFDNDSEFLLWGHDNGSMSNLNSIDIDGVIIGRRLNRVWKVSEVDDSEGSGLNLNPVGNVAMEVNISEVANEPITASDIYLLIDRDGDGFADNDITPIQASSWNQTTGIATFDAVDFRNCDNFTIGFKYGVNPLPVDLMSFNVKYEAFSRVVNIDWSTAAELNNDYFEVEKSIDLKSWNSIDRVNGKGTFNEASYYSTQDKDINATTLYYRLKQVDFDGKVHYSDIIAIQIPDYKPFGLSIYPNPANDVVNLNVENMLSTIEMTIYDQLGRVVQSSILNSNNTSINVSSLKNGIYICKLTDNGKTEQLRFTKK